jgi:hypothetical protein
MSTDQHAGSTNVEEAGPLPKAAALARQPYAVPRLTALADLRQMTLGGSGPLSESGGLRQFPPGPRPGG